MHVTYVINNIDLFTQIYRVYNIKEELFIKGITSSVVFEDDVLKDDKIYFSSIVILCRIRFSENINKFISNLNDKKIPVVFDIDDLVFDTKYLDFLCAVRENRSATGNAREDYTHIFNSVHETMRRCNAITCSTDILKEIIIEKYRKPTYVIPNTIGIKQLKLSDYLIPNKIKNDVIKIGYFSGTKTHNIDFLEVAEALREILISSKNVELNIFGNLNIPRCLCSEPLLIKSHGMAPYNTMLKNIALMDINIAPLEIGNIFNTCKSELKIFEASLMNVPTVASNIKNYSNVIESSVDGFLANNKNEWIIALQILINNEKIRREMAFKSREKCIKKFYIENIIDNIINIYRLIIQ